MQNNNGPQSGSMLRIIILVFGVGVFLLLLFADKTNLNSQVGPTKPDENIAQQAGVEAKLPPLSDPALASEIQRAKTVNGPQKVSLLDSLVHILEGSGRFDYAALLADELTGIETNATRKLRAGILGYQASQTPAIANDSLLFRSYSDMTMRNLESVVEEDETNEDALLYLGLSYVQSRLQQNAMRGILTIRKVVEINPKNAEAQFRLGSFSLQTGQFEKAVDRFEKVLAIRPDDNVARLQYAYGLSQLGKNQEARTELEFVIGESGNPELIQQAQSLLSQIQ